MSRRLQRLRCDHARAREVPPVPPETYAEALMHVKNLDGWPVKAWVDVAASDAASIAAAQGLLRDLVIDEERATFMVGDTQLSVDHASVLGVESYLGGTGIWFNVAGT